jgi:hypothetical protein
LARVQTSTHHLTIGEREVRKEFVADHEAQAEREWACLTLLAEHAPGLAPRPLRSEDGDRSGRLRTPGSGRGATTPASCRPCWSCGGWRRNPPGTTEAQAAHFMALAGQH